MMNYIINCIVVAVDVIHKNILFNIYYVKGIGTILLSIDHTFTVLKSTLTIKE